MSTKQPQGCPSTYYEIAFSEARRIVGILGKYDKLDPDAGVTAHNVYRVDKDEWAGGPVEGIRATSFTWADPDSSYTVGDRGEVRASRSGVKTVEQLPDSGLDGRRLGPPTRVRMIAGQPWVCGFAGQVYTLRGGRWVHVDQGLAEEHADPGKSIELASIDGTDANNVFAVGSDGLVAHWDGRSWERIPLLTNAYLSSVRVLRPDYVIAVGDHAVIVEGNGMRVGNGLSVEAQRPRWIVDQILPAKPNDLQLSDVISYRNQLYVAAGKTIYVREGDRWTDACLFRGAPKDADYFKLAVGADRLWVMGTKRLVSYDGRRWRTHRDPDNG
jgi:hypothetical protein